MLFIPGDASLTFRFDLDYGDHTFHVIRFLTYHISDAILGHIPFRMRFTDLHGVARSSQLTGYTQRRGPVLYFIVILRWSPSWVVYPDLHLSALRCDHVSPSEVRLFDLWVWFSYGHRWLGLHIRWWMIWGHLIFWPITHLVPYWGIFPFWLSFVDVHWFAWLSLVTRCMLGLWLDFILSWFFGGAFLEPFDRAYILWCCHDSWMYLSQMHRLPHHHFNGVQVKSSIRSHRVILELSGQMRGPSCYTGAHSPF